MGWHIQEFGKASAIKQKLSQTADAYDNQRDAALRAEVPPHLTPAYLPKTDPVEEKFRQAAVDAIIAALEEARGDVHVTLNAHGHSQPVRMTEEQLRSLPQSYNRDTKQVTLTITLSTQV